VDDQKLVRLLKALADSGRFRMVQEIAAAGELTCGQVGERFDLTQPTISHHLKILADAEILLVRRDGQHVIISVNHDLVEHATAMLPLRLKRKARTSSRRVQAAQRRSKAASFLRSRRSG
jgi:ArsR family transcriptional regulator, arsenate/arsenite/antimonite-responsive transcriptional repressor